MQRFSIFLLLLLGFIGANEIIAARDLCYLQNYHGAGMTLRMLLEKNGDDPAVLFWQAALLQMLVFDSGNTGLLDSFYRTTDSVVKLCQTRLRENPTDARAHFYWGLAELNRANCQSWQNRKFAAFMTMLKVPAHFRRALVLEPKLDDAWFGLGTIEYFKATADRYCFGLGLLGSRERAYHLVRRAQKEGELLQPMAEYLLGFMMKEDRLFADAVSCCERLLARYPENRSARRLLRDIYLDMGRYEEVIAVGRELDEDIRSTFSDNRYGIAENWLKMAYAWHSLGETDSVRVYTERIINWTPFQNSVPWLANYVQEAKRLRTKCARSETKDRKRSLVLAPRSTLAYE
ncbi:MAG: hypothetical protein ACUVUR_00465 [bacterium]